MFKCWYETLGEIRIVLGSTKPNDAGYTPTVEYRHNLTPHTSMLLQNHSETYQLVMSGNFGIGTTYSLMMVQWDRNMLE